MIELHAQPSKILHEDNNRAVSENLYFSSTPGPSTPTYIFSSLAIPKYTDLQSSQHKEALKHF